MFFKNRYTICLKTRIEFLFFAFFQCTPRSSSPTGPARTDTPPTPGPTTPGRSTRCHTTSTETEGHAQKQKNGNVEEELQKKVFVS